MDLEARPPPDGPPVLMVEGTILGRLPPGSSLFAPKPNKGARLLASYSTNNPFLLEANKYECGISAVVFSSGTSPHLLGVDVERYAFTAVHHSFRLTFSQINNILKNSDGGGKAIVLLNAGLNYLELFRQTEVLCRFFEPAVSQRIPLLLQCLCFVQN